MAVVLKPEQAPMASHSNHSLWIIAALLMGQVLSGCVTLQINKINSGAEVLSPPAEFIPGKTSLQEVLSYYGAPTQILEMEGHFALRYQRNMQRDARLAFGIPLLNMVKVGLNLDTMGNLMRHDAAVFVFTPEGILENMKYEKNTSLSSWDTYWK
jgi:hypothetical protein